MEFEIIYAKRNECIGKYGIYDTIEKYDVYDAIDIAFENGALAVKCNNKFIWFNENIQQFVNGGFKKWSLEHLRREICLHSLYASDYNNTFGLNKHFIQNFFDGFAENIQEKVREEFGTLDNYGKVTELDNADELYDYYCSIDYSCSDEYEFFKQNEHITKEILQLNLKEIEQLEQLED